MHHTVYLYTPLCICDTFSDGSLLKPTLFFFFDRLAICGLFIYFCSSWQAYRNLPKMQSISLNNEKHSSTKMLFSNTFLIFPGCVDWGYTFLTLRTRADPAVLPGPQSGGVRWQLEQIRESFLRLIATKPSMFYLVTSLKVRLFK